MFEIFDKLIPSALTKDIKLLMVDNKKIDNNITFSLKTGDTFTYIGLSLKGNKDELWDKVFNIPYPIFCIIGTGDGLDIYYQLNEKGELYKEQHSTITQYIYNVFGIRGKKTLLFKIPGSINWDVDMETKVEVLYHEKDNYIEWGEMLRDSRLFSDYLDVRGIFRRDLKKYVESDDIVEIGDIIENFECDYESIIKELNIDITDYKIIDGILLSEENSGNPVILLLNHFGDYSNLLSYIGKHLDIPEYTISAKKSGLLEVYPGIYQDDVGLQYLDSKGDKLTNFIADVIGHVFKFGQFIILLKLKTKGFKTDVIEVNGTSFMKLNQILMSSGPFIVFKKGTLILNIITQQANKKKLISIPNVGYYDGFFFGGVWRMDKHGKIQTHRGGVIGKYYLDYLFDEYGNIDENIRLYDKPDKTTSLDDLTFLETKIMNKHPNVLATFLTMTTIVISSLLRERGYFIPMGILSGEIETGKTTSLNFCRKTLGVQLPIQSGYTVGRKKFKSLILSGMPIIIGEYSTSDKRDFYKKIFNSMYDGVDIDGRRAVGGIILDTNAIKESRQIMSRSIKLEYTIKGKPIIDETKDNYLYPILLKFLSIGKKEFDDVFNKFECNDRIDYNYNLLKTINHFIGLPNRNNGLGHNKVAQKEHSKYDILIDKLRNNEGDGTD